MLRVFTSLDEAARAVASRVVESAADAVRARGSFRLALPGGSTPRTLFRRLAEPEWRARIDWSRVTILLTDERAVPRGEHERNDAQIAALLMAPLGLGEDRLRPMRAEAADLEAAAAEYERELESPIDLVVLGVGPDGHIASIFPGRPLVAETVRRAAAEFESPKPPPRRLSLTPRALREARDLVVLCAGADKAAAIEAALGDPADPNACPAALAASADWFVDRAAAPAG